MRTAGVYRELTMRGTVVCVLAGIFEEIAVFWLLGIQWAVSPVYVTVFLGLLFAVLTGAAMLGIDELRCAFRRTQPEDGQKEGAVTYAWPEDEPEEYELRRA